ncbi:hypothetical protein C8R44DRAFT_747954 [Mycena epipterygia]|nr:hypothetical protein C8R44DRAFT_747954 [Mycena epipterygia]
MSTVTAAGEYDLRILFLARASSFESHSLLDAVRNRDDDEHHAKLHDQHDDQHTEHDVATQTHLRSHLRQRRLRSPLTEPDRSRTHGPPVPGVCAFLEAAQGMESGLMGEAARLLMLSEVGARKAAADAKKTKTGGGGRLGAGLEWKSPNADADGILHGLLPVHVRAQRRALKVTKLFHTVFPHCLEHPSVSATATSPSRTLRTSISVSGLPVAGLSISDSSGSSSPRICELEREHSDARRPRLCPRSIALDIRALGRLGLVLLREPGAPPRTGGTERVRPAEGPVEEMIVAGTAFAVSPLLISTLPTIDLLLAIHFIFISTRSVIIPRGLPGFKHDRALALRALTFSGGCFRDSLDSFRGWFPSRLALLPGFPSSRRLFCGIESALVSAGVDADGTGGRGVHDSDVQGLKDVVDVLCQFQGGVDRLNGPMGGWIDAIEARYPTGALWILNRVRLDPAHVGRRAGRDRGAAAQARGAADLVFELAWTLLAQRQHQEAASAFVRLTELNLWSNATYYFIAAACYVSLGNRDKAQEPSPKAGDRDDRL